MAERLTASLEDGTLEKLRTLAGGERKVGAYLSQVVTHLLWPHRDTIDDVGLPESTILPRSVAQKMLGADPQTIKDMLSETQAELSKAQAEFVELDARLKALEAQAQLNVSPTQEDSSRNDA